MKKAGKVITIILAAVIALFFLRIFVWIFSTSTPWSLTQDDIINLVQQNAELLNEVPDEIKNIEETSFYIYADKKNKTDNISITYAPIYNIVVCTLHDNNFKLIINKVFYRVFKIDENIMSIERYYSKSGRLCIMIDCGLGRVLLDFIIQKTMNLLAGRAKMSASESIKPDGYTMIPT